MRLLSSSMFGLLLVCMACAGDSFQAGNDNASGGTSGGESGSGEAGSEGGEAGGSAGGEAGVGSSGGTAGSAPVCGNGIVDTDEEQCDEQAFKTTCVTAGALSCSKECTTQLGTCGAQDCGPSGALHATAPWPARRRCLSNIARSPIASSQHGQLLWEIEPLPGTTSSTSPLINAQNEILVLRSDSSIRRILATGEEQPAHVVPNVVPDTLSIDTANNVVMLTNENITKLVGETHQSPYFVINGQFLALLPDPLNDPGYIACSTDSRCQLFQSNNYSSILLNAAPAAPLTVVPGGQVIVPTTSGFMLVSKTAQAFWEPFSPMEPKAATARGDGTVFCVATKPGTVSITARYGNDFASTAWNKTLSFAERVTAITLDPLGRPFIGIDRSWLSFDPNGASVPEYTASGALLDVSVFGADGTAYLGTADGKILAVRSGKLLWERSFSLQGEVVAGFAIDALGRLVVVSTMSRVQLYSVD